MLQLVQEGPAATTLRMDIDVILDGVLGVLGAPLIELAAHEMARQFFQGLRALAAARGRVRARRRTRACPDASVPARACSNSPPNPNSTESPACPTPSSSPAPQARPCS